MGAEFGGRVGEPVDEFLVKVAFEVGGVALEVAVEFFDGADGGVDDDAAVVATFVPVKYAFLKRHIVAPIGRIVFCVGPCAACGDIFAGQAQSLCFGCR